MAKEGTATDFQRMTKQLFILLGTHHHWGYVQRAARAGDVPKAMHRIKNYIAGVINPSNRTTRTLVLINSNAENWLQTNLQMLEDYYSNTIQELRTSLCQFAGQDYGQPVV
ncbi:hypothetical protein VZT92_002691 [Zoarces viviparus]|uniref:Uncharacterized protein n=1 Tax=Zoarces viviparus TaxID=48416 RepID=A0AAW1G168_ZOAVI